MYLCVFSLTSSTNLDKPTPLYLEAANKWLLHFSNCFLLTNGCEVNRGHYLSALLLFFIKFFSATLWLTELRLASQCQCFCVFAPFTHLWVVNVHVAVTAWRDYFAHFLWSLCVLLYYSVILFLILTYIQIEWVQILVTCFTECNRVEHYWPLIKYWSVFLFLS